MELTYELVKFYNKSQNTVINAHHFSYGKEFIYWMDSNFASKEQTQQEAEEEFLKHKLWTRSGMTL